MASTASRTELSQRGVLLLAAGVLAFVIGLAGTDGVLAALGLLALLLLPLSGWMARRNLRGLSLRMQAASRTYAGQGFPARFLLEREAGNGGARIVSARIDLPGRARHVCHFGSATVNGEMCCDEVLDLPQRGHSPQLSYVLESEFPFGIWKASAPGVIPHALSVYPRPLVSRKLSIPGLWRDATAMAGTTFGAMAGDLRGLRPWRAGDSLKRVHHAASARAFARGAGLVVAEQDPPGFFPRHVTVMFHSYAGDRAIIRPEMFERALGYLCGTLRTLWQQSIPTTLMADFDGWLEYPCRNRLDLTEILERLARVRRCAGTELHEFLQAQRSVHAESSLIVLSDLPVADWRAAVIKRALPAQLLPVQLARETPTRKKR
jgi:uncharacterized protein (DUF58 family)